MIDLLAFAVVAFALGTPGLVHLLWGQIEAEQPNGSRASLVHTKAAKRHPRISDDRLGELLGSRRARGAIDVICGTAGGIDIRLTGALRRN